jgi:hypothetical protein
MTAPWLRGRRSPPQGEVVLILVVGLLILQAYANVKRSTAMFGKVTFLTGTLVNVQREALPLEDQSPVREVVHALETSRLSPRLLTPGDHQERAGDRHRHHERLAPRPQGARGAAGHRRLRHRLLLARLPAPLPVDMLKIDKAFVDGIGHGREDTDLANAIGKLSHTLQLHTVAEGIEQATQATQPVGQAAVA